MLPAEAGRWKPSQACSWGHVAISERALNQESRLWFQMCRCLLTSLTLSPWPQAGEDRVLRQLGTSYCVHHSVPETAIKVPAQTNLTQSVPALGYRTINLNYQEVSMRDNWKRNATLLLPRSCHPETHLLPCTTATGAAKESR